MKLLYPAMEDYHLDLMIVEGRRTLHQADLASLHPLGATTRAGF